MLLNIIAIVLFGISAIAAVHTYFLLLDRSAGYAVPYYKRWFK